MFIQTHDPPGVFWAAEKIGDVTRLSTRVSFVCCALNESTDLLERLQLGAVDEPCFT